MKKYLNIAFSIALCLAGMSCVQELNEEQIVDPSSGIPVTLSVTDADWESTRSAFTPGVGIKLTNNEKIGLLYDDGSLYVGNSSYAIAASPRGGGKYDFTAPEGSLDKTWYGVVPYSRELTRAQFNNRYLLLTFPSIQFPGQNTFDPQTDILVSKPFKIDGTGAKTASINAFKRLTAPFKLQITGLNPGEKIYAVTFDYNVTASSADLNTMAGRCHYNVGTTPDDVQWAAVALPLTRTNSISAVYDEGLMAEGGCWPVWFNIRPIRIYSGKTVTVTVFTADACYKRTVDIKAGYFDTKRINSFTVDIKGSGYEKMSAISQGLFHNGMPDARVITDAPTERTVSLTATDGVARNWDMKAYNWTASLDGGSMLPDALGFPCQTGKDGYIKLPAVAGKTITKVRLYLAPVSLTDNKDFPLYVYDGETLKHTVECVSMVNQNKGYSPGGFIDIAPDGVTDMTGMTLKFNPKINYTSAALVSRIVLFTAP